MTYNYQKAVPGDKVTIFNLYSLVMRDFIARIWGWDKEWQEKDFGEHFEPESITVVQEHGQLVAYSQVENREDQLYIRMMVVHPKHQGNGIGNKLLEAVIQTGKQNAKNIGLEVFKINPKAKGFYARHGFRVIGETQSSYSMEHSLT